MGFFRWMFGLPLAAAATIGLFLMMAALIRSERPPESPGPEREISILPKIKQEPLQRKTRAAPPDSAPPPPDRVFSVDPERVAPVDVTPPPRNPGGITPDDVGVMRPIIRPQPAFPEQCRARGAEGVVIVEFDVTERGEVVNARVLSSSNSCFDRAAVKAVLGWKYPPQARRGVTEQFRFELTD